LHRVFGCSEFVRFGMTVTIANKQTTDVQLECSSNFVATKCRHMKEVRAQS